MKILVAVDGSKNSLDAVKFVVDHAKWYRDTPGIELVYVHPPVPSFRNMNLAVSKAELQRYYNEEGEGALDKAKRILERSSMGYIPRILVGPVPASIVQHANKANCDLIVLATRGMGATGNLLLGSTTTKLLHISKVPVLVVKSA